MGYNMGYEKRGHPFSVFGQPFAINVVDLHGAMPGDANLS